MKDEVSFICEEEQEAFDNMPEGLQESERGLQMSDNISTPEDLDPDFSTMIDSLQEVIDA